jgi:signal peptidase
MRIFLSFIKLILTVFISLIALYALSTNLNILTYKSFVVQSGSMEPAIMTGDIVVVSHQEKYFVNDVVTFYDADHKIITHRLVEINNEYLTKGDANRSFDEAKVSSSQIIGKVILVVPRLGYLMAFIKTTKGLIILVLIPAAIYIIDELLKIMKNAKQER